MEKSKVNFDVDVDVCIIGGSIAGNYLACLLAEKNVNCIVIEEHYELGKPFQCAGIISQKILTLLDFPDDIILNRVHIAEIVAPNLVSIKMSGSESPVIIDRVRFDAYFGCKAQGLGVKYYLGEKYLKHWALSKTDVIIKTSKRIIKARMVVGADGPFSKVAAHFNQKNYVIPAVQARFEMKYPINQTSMYFNPRWKELFGYVVPEKEGSVCRVGLATKNHPNKAFQLFLKKLNLSSVNQIDRQGGALPVGLLAPMVFQNTVLIGDSACMVKATTGGGIIMLVSAAKILAPAISLAISQKNFSHNFLYHHYERKVRKSIGRELKLHYIIRILLEALAPHEFNYFFHLYTTTSLQNVIREYADMDFPLKLIKKLFQEGTFIRYVFYLGFKYYRMIPKVFSILFK
ncbi:lycopene cyclase family protein [Candidatus Lokiarchaeum ossiferum]|uniref:lycopene cyclase family protein n=1 Tax=Candidatus Lokiarchaeum ossiferum TaxID=2951803 RepID=UPI00352DA09D